MIALTIVGRMNDCVNPVGTKVAGIPVTTLVARWPGAKKTIGSIMTEITLAILGTIVVVVVAEWANAVLAAL